MSFYNMMCGNNPCYQMPHAVLATVGELPDIPRYRDTYTLVEGDGIPYIVIYTRTGGGNREEYEDQNQEMGTHPLYVSDWDDDFDSTFAHFKYRVPEDWVDDVNRFHELFSRHPKGMTPRQKFDGAMAALNGDGSSKVSNPLNDEEVDELAQITVAMASRLGMIVADQGEDTDDEQQGSGGVVQEVAPDSVQRNGRPGKRGQDAQGPA